MNHTLLVGTVALLALSTLSQLAAWRTRVPAVVFALALGFIAGPVTELLRPSEVLGAFFFPLVSLSAAVVLFEGGLTASWREIRHVAVPVRRLSTVGIVLSFLLITASGIYIGKMDSRLAALTGAILVVTGPTVVGPILRHAKARGSLASILKLEGIISDPLGAILAVLVFQYISADSGATGVTTVIQGIVVSFVVSAALALAATWTILHLQLRVGLPETLQPTVVLTISLLVFVLANVVYKESGLLAITILGIALASQRQVSMDRTMGFVEPLRSLLIPVLFIVLTATLKLDDLRHVSFGTMAFVVSLIVIVRPVVVALSLLATDLPVRARVFVAAMAPRGVVAVAVASVFTYELKEVGFESASSLATVIFLVIATTVMVYGLSARTMVRLLRVGTPDRDVALLVGINDVTIEIGRALQSAGVEVELAGSGREDALYARQQGLRVRIGQVMFDSFRERLVLQRFSLILVAMEDDHANTLAAALLSQETARGTVFQLQPHEARTSQQPYAAKFKQSHFAGGHTYDELEATLRAGVEPKLTTLSESFGWKDFKAHHGDSVLPLFNLPAEGKILVLSGDADREHEFEPGDRILSLALSS